jgi:hypothetical protein
VITLECSDRFVSISVDGFGILVEILLDVDHVDEDTIPVVVASHADEIRKFDFLAAEEVVRRLDRFGYAFSTRYR